MKDYYQILDLPRTATLEDITSRFRVLAKAHHPDIDHSNDAESRFRDIFEAYDMLRYPERRVAYDAALDEYSVESEGVGETDDLRTDEESGADVGEWASESANRASKYSKMRFQQFAEAILYDHRYYARIGWTAYIYYCNAMLLTLAGIAVLLRSVFGLIIIGVGVFLAVKGSQKIKYERLMQQFRQSIRRGEVICPQCGSGIHAEARDVYGIKGHRLDCGRCHWRLFVEE